MGDVWVTVECDTEGVGTCGTYGWIEGNLTSYPQFDSSDGLPLGSLNFKVYGVGVWYGSSEEGWVITGVYAGGTAEGGEILADPEPQIYGSLAPDAITPGSAGFTLTVNGFGFRPQSTVLWNGSARPTTFVSPSQLAATIYAADVSAPTTALVAVTSPNNVDASNTAYFSVTQPTSTLALSRQDNSTPAQPESVVAADFNGDGHLDLAVANYSGFVSVMLGSGGGTFQSRVDYPVGTGARSIIVGDFNGSGKLDLAVANQTAGTISILQGNGDGTFQSHVDYPVGTDPFLLVAGDFDGDGALDLAVVNQNENQVSILFGLGDGTFASGGSYSTGQFPFGILTGDFNGDGNLDLAVANYKSDTVSILLGNGDGTFQSHQDYPTGQYPEMLATADFNGDGKLDLAVGTNQTANPQISVLLGNGDGTFGKPTGFPAGSRPRSLVPADLNGDGKLDLAVANYGSSTVSLLLGNGNGTFSPAGSYSTGLSPQSITAGDFAGSGRLDLATANYGASTASVMLQVQTPIVQVSPSNLSFGSQPVGTTSATKPVTVANIGAAMLDISNIVPSTDFAISANTCGATLAAGGNCELSVTFTPTKVGVLKGTLTFTDNASNSPQMLALSGTGFEPPTLTPANATYTKLKVGNTSTAKTFTLTNTGTTTLTSIAISTTGDFAVKSTTCGTSLAAKGKCTISVTFTPTGTGTRTGELKVSDSASNSPQIASLTGTGD